MSKKQILIIASLMIASVAVGGLLATKWGKVELGFAAPPFNLGSDKPPVLPSNEVKVLNDAFVAVSKAVTSQVVSITATTKLKETTSKKRFNPFGDGEENPFGDLSPFFGNPNGGGFGQDMPTRGAGSGVIVSTDGYIMTNNHVVAGATEISVKTNDGEDYPAKLIGRDSLTDIAIIKIDKKDLSAATFANSDNVQVGQLALAVGNPLGTLNSTVTQGIVSALGRGLNALGGEQKSYAVENFIQTDAAINPGNSGGGLFNISGELIGINTAIASRTGSFIGYGFAVPINLAKNVAEDIIEDGKVDRGYIGVSIQNIDDKLAKGLKLPSRQGVLVQDLVENGSAATAGIKVDDVILEVDGQKVNASNQLQSLIAQKRAGQNVKLKIWRGGSLIEKIVSLKPRSDDITSLSESDDKQSDSKSSNSNMKFDKLGLEVRSLRLEEKNMVKVDGVVVANVDIYGEASDQGITNGDVIISADRVSIKSPSELKKVIDSKSSGDVVLLQVKSRNSTRLVALQIK